MSRCYNQDFESLRQSMLPATESNCEAVKELMSWMSAVSPEDADYSNDIIKLHERASFIGGVAASIGLDSYGLIPGIDEQIARFRSSDFSIL